MMLKELLDLCQRHDCIFHNLELHPQHGWDVRVTFSGWRACGTHAESVLLATVDAIRNAKHLHATHSQRPEWTDLSDIPL